MRRPPVLDDLPGKHIAFFFFCVCVCVCVLQPGPKLLLHLGRTEACARRGRLSTSLPSFNKSSLRPSRPRDRSNTLQAVRAEAPSAPKHYKYLPNQHLPIGYPQNAVRQQARENAMDNPRHTNTSLTPPPPPAAALSCLYTLSQGLSPLPPGGAGAGALFRNLLTNLSPPQPTTSPSFFPGNSKKKRRSMGWGVHFV